MSYPDRRKLGLVVAGNRREFETFIRTYPELGASYDFRYVASVDDLRGARNYHVFQYGTFYSRHDSELILEQLHAAAHAKDHAGFSPW